jgi:hypothetical protein
VFDIFFFYTVKAAVKYSSEVFLLTSRVDGTWLFRSYKNILPLSELPCHKKAEILRYEIW